MNTKIMKAESLLKSMTQSLGLLVTKDTCASSQSHCHTRHHTWDYDWHFHRQHHHTCMAFQYHLVQRVIHHVPSSLGWVPSLESSVYTMETSPPTSPPKMDHMPGQVLPCAPRPHLLSAFEAVTLAIWIHCLPSSKSVQSDDVMDQGPSMQIYSGHIYRPLHSTWSGFSSHLLHSLRIYLHTSQMDIPPWWTQATLIHPWDSSLASDINNNLMPLDNLYDLLDLPDCPQICMLDGIHFLLFHAYVTGSWHFSVLVIFIP